MSQEMGQPIKLSPYAFLSDKKQALFDKAPGCP
jgi:hypothetical protein